MTEEEEEEEDDDGDDDDDDLFFIVVQLLVLGFDDTVMVDDKKYNDSFYLFVGGKMSMDEKETSIIHYLCERGRQHPHHDKVSQLRS